MAGRENYFDSEEVMSWLLLNPELVEFENSHLPVIPAGGNVSSSSSDRHHMDSFHFMGPSPDIFDLNDPHTDYSSGREGKEDRKAKYREKYVKTGQKREREVEDIEGKIAKLKAENEDLQSHLRNVMQRTTEIQKQRQEMEQQMFAELVKIGDDENADQSALAVLVNKFTDIYADYGRCRQKEVNFHVNQLEKLILPTRTTKLCLWALQQDDNFFNSTTSPMFDILSKELDISSEQTEKITERRARIGTLLAQLNENLTLLNSFKSAIEKKHASYDRICGRVQDIATPRQVVHFLLWQRKNADAMSKFIPNYSRNIQHTPNVAFIDSVYPAGGGSAASSSSSSSSAAAGAAPASTL